MGSCWHRGAGDGLIRSRASYVIDLGRYLAYTELDPETKNRKSVSCSSIPALSGLIAAQVAFWLPGLVAVEFGGRCSMIIRGLAIVCLNILS